MLKAVGSALKKLGGNWMKKGSMAKGMDVVGAGMGIYFGADAYQEARQEGSGVFMSAVKGVKEFALPFLLSPAGYMAYSAVSDAPGLAVDMSTAYSAKARQTAMDMKNTAFANSMFSDSEQVHTMRQAGLAQIQRSKYNTQQALLGSEAKYMMR